ncbi:hypothetical protein [Kordia sp.]|uniref:hypothetical protein n=1 Tax=Kordia sp. TaxID=1965332 RepID=UPI003B5C59AF
MHKNLVLSAFEKAKKEIREATGVNMSITGLSKQISDYMMEECRFQYHEKSLRNKYNTAIKGETVELKSSVANCLCNYLGYNSYADFILKNRQLEVPKQVSENVSIEHAELNNNIIRKEPSMSEKLKIIIQKNKVTLIFCSLVFLLYFGLYSINKQRWMVWNQDRYVEVKFDVDKYGLSNLKVYKSERIQSFRKVTPDCNYAFFKPNGRENLWYQKSVSGNIEFFSSFGLHPETGKTLKKITPYMIQKYICESY